MKRYIAKTNVSVNVVLENGKNMHISFSPLTGRGESVYYTDSPEIKAALEKHYKFGKLFKLDQTYQKGEKNDKTARRHDKGDEADAAEGKIQKDATIDERMRGEDEEEAEGNNIIVVTDPEEAKDYLCEHFGISRTKIKGLRSIKEYGAANNITFKGLN